MRTLRYLTGSKALPWNPYQRGSASTGKEEAEPPDLRYQALLVTSREYNCLRYL